MSVTSTKATGAPEFYLIEHTRSVTRSLPAHVIRLPRCIPGCSQSISPTDSGPQPFVLQCSTPWRGFCDTINVHRTIVNNALIETRVDLAAGRLTAAEWLQPIARREKCCLLIGSGTGAWLFILERMVRIVIRFQIFSPYLRKILHITVDVFLELGLSTDY